MTWAGQHRAPLSDQPVYPRPVQDPIPVWIAVGGTPQSVVRAGTLGLPLALGIIGGQPERFASLASLYREAADRADHNPESLNVGINTHAYITDESQQAADEFFPAYAQVMTQLGRERGWPSHYSPAIRSDEGSTRRPGRWEPAGGHR